MSLPVVSPRYTPEDLLTLPDGHRFDLEPIPIGQIVCT